MPPDEEDKNSPVVLSTKHRASIYQGLAPVIGEEEADAMLSEFPAREGDELATKEFVRAELAELRMEIRVELHQRLREMTMRMAGALTAGMGLAAAIGTALGSALG